MVDKPSLSTRWHEYRPSKAGWFWSCVFCIVATIVVGFVWSGWVTAGTAKSMADDAAQKAQAQLAANYCVARFEASTDAANQLASLKKTEEWGRDDFITKGGWVTPPGAKQPIDGAADLCAQRLLTAKLLPATTSTPVKPATTGG
jgi:hypothetical protein